MTGPTFKGIGIDPGAVNLGWAVVDRFEDTPPFKVRIVATGTDDPRSMPDLPLYITERISAMTKASFFEEGMLSATIERFVPYAGSKNDIMEEVNQLIGMFRFALSNLSLDVNMVRAIEWKTKLVKLLNKHCGFENPGKNGALDKSFSLAAARFISLNPESISDDHKADAVCLAALPYLEHAAKLANAANKVRT